MVSTPLDLQPALLSPVWFSEVRCSWSFQFVMLCMLMCFPCLHCRTVSALYLYMYGFIH